MASEIARIKSFSKILVNAKVYFVKHIEVDNSELIKKIVVKAARIDTVPQEIEIDFHP